MYIRSTRSKNFRLRPEFGVLPDCTQFRNGRPSKVLFDFRDQDNNYITFDCNGRVQEPCKVEGLRCNR